MKILLLLVLFASVAHAAQDCSDLSHRTTLGAADVEVRQIGCERLSRQMFLAGSPVGEASTVELNGKWKTDAVDDDYETYTRQTRWKWNSSRTSIIYEFVINSFSKDSGEESFLTGSHVYAPAAEGVKLEKSTLARTMKKDGTLSTKQNQESLMLERLESATVSVEFVGPCESKPFLEGTLSSRDFQNVGGLTIQVLKDSGIPYLGTEKGLAQVLSSPIGLDAMETVSETEIMAYGWCYEVDGVLREEFPNEASLNGVKKIRWFYGYAHYRSGVWIAQCLESHQRRSPFICK